MERYDVEEVGPPGTSRCLVIRTMASGSPLVRLCYLLISPYTYVFQMTGGAAGCMIRFESKSCLTRRVLCLDIPSQSYGCHR